MKTHLIFAAALLAASCQPSLDTGSPRSSHFVKTRYGDGEEVVIPTESSSIDTTICFCAVDFPQGYDWKKDSACGNSSATLRIYRNFELVASFGTGESLCIGTDPDTHHWLNGNLYSEYNLYGQTVISRNGKELFRYEGKEFLKGLLEIDGDIWTLGQNCSGRGFSLRCNGDEVLKRTDGVIFGDLASWTHEGLYLDSGKICFCYQRETVSTNNLYKVIDSKESLHTTRSQTVHDMKISSGAVQIVQSTSEFTLYEKDYSVFQIGEKDIRTSDAWLCDRAGGVLVCIALKGEGEQEYLGWSKGNPGSIGRGEHIYLYPNSDGTMKYVTFGSGGMFLHDLQKGELASFEKPSVFSRSCLGFAGEDWFLAHNMKGNGGMPRIVYKNKSVPVQVNGYISALEVTVKEREEE